MIHYRHNEDWKSFGDLNPFPVFDGNGFPSELHGLVNESRYAPNIPYIVCAILGALLLLGTAITVGLAVIWLFTVAQWLGGLVVGLFIGLQF